MNLDDTLRDQAITNGSLDDSAELAQAMKFVLRRGKNWDTLPPVAKEALERTATHISMILTGDANEAGHWNSIAGLMRTRGKALENFESGIQRLARAKAILRTVENDEELQT